MKLALRSKLRTLNETRCVQYMLMFSSDTLARIEAIGRLGFTNPFGEERTRLESVIVGADAARSAPWSRSLDWPIGDLTLAAITEEAERHMAAAQAALQHGDTLARAVQPGSGNAAAIAGADHDHDGRRRAAH